MGGPAYGKTHFHSLAVSSNNAKVSSRILGFMVYKIMETPFLTKGSLEICYSIWKTLFQTAKLHRNLQASLTHKYMS